MATSLATPYFWGIVDRYKRRAMTFNPLRKVASNIRYEPPLRDISDECHVIVGLGNRTRYNCAEFIDIELEMSLKKS